MRLRIAPIASSRWQSPMADPVTITVNGATVHADAGTTLAAVLLGLRRLGYRRSGDATLRGPLCGMGICFECRVTVNGAPDRRACMTRVAAGMRVEIDG